MERTHLCLLLFCLSLPSYPSCQILSILGPAHSRIHLRIAEGSQKFLNGILMKSRGTGRVYLGLSPYMSGGGHERIYDAIRSRHGGNDHSWEILWGGEMKVANHNGNIQILEANETSSFVFGEIGKRNDIDLLRTYLSASLHPEAQLHSHTQKTIHLDSTLNGLVRRDKNLRHELGNIWLGIRANLYVISHSLGGGKQAQRTVRNRIRKDDLLLTHLETLERDGIDPEPIRVVKGFLMKIRNETFTLSPGDAKELDQALEKLYAQVETPVITVLKVH